ncbi:hypothetical protein LIA77_09374 [Sarocladium implicatum]|nr:hypothetical protein LIA77_09374 [Sarocladium implicatum]
MMHDKRAMRERACELGLLCCHITCQSHAAHVPSSPAWTLQPTVRCLTGSLSAACLSFFLPFFLPILSPVLHPHFRRSLLLLAPRCQKPDSHASKARKSIDIYEVGEMDANP